MSTSGCNSAAPSLRPASLDSNHSQPPHDDEPYDQPSENSPLLSRAGTDVEAPDNSVPQSQSAASLLRSFKGDGKGGQRWPSILALILLCIVVVLVMVLGFIVPATVQEYAMQAATFEPTSLSIDSFTTSGVRARIQGDFVMDASKVKKKSVRDLGRFGTWIARKAETGESEVEVSLPEYGNVVLGTAAVPKILVDIRNGHRTQIDFLTNLKPGEIDGIRRIAKDWIDGRLGQLRILSKASVPLRSGIINIGKQKLVQEITFANKDIPAIPDYKIHKLNFHEENLPLPDLEKVMVADVSLEVSNDYPLEFTVPPLGFAILVDGCTPSDPYIQIADATTGSLHIEPKEDLKLNVSGIVRQLPDAFTQACPHSPDSPLDLLLGQYIHGNTTTIYVRGSDSPDQNTPRWITDLVSDITVPVPFPGHTFGHLIKNFSLADVHFGLPDPFAEPNSPEAQPHITANVKALIALPEEMNFNISVGRVRADADVYYHDKKLGKLDLKKWRPANSTRVEPTKDDEGPMLLVQSLVENAPLTIEDDDVFTEVVQALVFGSKRVYLSIKADVDVQMETALGELAVRKIPAQGMVPIKPIRSHNDVGSFRPKVGDLQILSTAKGSITLGAVVNFTNPTEYTATVPYVDIHIGVNGTLLGHATAENVKVVPGENVGLPVTAVWFPSEYGGEEGPAVGKELLSQYISGYNTTITLSAHNGSIPSQPALGHALQSLSIDMPTPSLRNPGDDGDDEDDGGNKGPHFIKDATMHLITSTAQFTLLSPLRHTPLWITYINATAFYHGDSVGHILYDLPFVVPPGATTSPRLPVDWSLGSVGYDAVKGALGGTLKLNAQAQVGVRIGEWEERVWFVGGGIGAKIRL